MATRLYLECSNKLLARILDVRLQDFDVLNTMKKRERALLNKVDDFHQAEIIRHRCWKARRSVANVDKIDSFQTFGFGRTNNQITSCYGSEDDPIKCVDLLQEQSMVLFDNPELAIAADRAIELIECGHVITLSWS